MNKERNSKYIAIIQRAQNEGLYDGEMLSLLMDIESADLKFNLRLDDWLTADKFNFAHDLFGIMDHIVRDSFPATDFGFFVPRFAASMEE